LDQTDMRKGTHHTAETRLAIRLKRLQKSMPPEAFAEFIAAEGALKWCPACKHLLLVSEFHKNRRSWDGLYDRCKDCNSEISNAWHRKNAQDDEYREAKNQRQAEWRAANKGEKQTRANKRYNLKQLYGITIKQFEQMLAAQDYRCAICPRSLKGRGTAHVDHDHRTGRVRGILCTSCNNGLGRFQDSPATLRRAARYLERAAADAAPTLNDGAEGTRWGAPALVPMPTA
jgi:hypothetical protein